MLKPGMKIRWYRWVPSERVYPGVIITAIDNGLIYCKLCDGTSEVFHHPENIGKDGWIILEYPLASNIKGKVRGYGSRKDIL